MIVASLLLVIAAAVTLLVGLLNREVIEWVYASIALCLLAGLMLTVGVLRSRPSRKPVLQSGGEGQASWSGASQWGTSGEQGEGAAVLTRDDDGDVRVTSTPDSAAGDDEPTRTAMPAPAAEDADSAWAPAAHDDTGDLGDGKVGAPEPEAAPAEGEAAPESQAAVEDEVVVVPKPSARGGKRGARAGAAKAAAPGAGRKSAAAKKKSAPSAAKKSAPSAAKKSAPSAAKKSAPSAAKKSAPSAAKKSAPSAARATTDDAARFEQVLSPIAGVGPGKRAALFVHFGTYRKLRAASPEKLAEAPGISRTLADRIHQALHSE